jgi:hypothetical protein
VHVAAATMKAGKTGPGFSDAILDTRQPAASCDLHRPTDILTWAHLASALCDADGQWHIAADCDEHDACQPGLPFQ